MIRLSVLYPAGDGITFDHDYYRDKHVPFVAQVWQPVGAEIDKGVDGPYLAAVHVTFASMDDLQAAMGKPEMEQVMADVQNYTNAQPVLQISEIQQ